MMTAGGLINARVYLAELVAILQSQLSQHGNDTQCRFPVTTLCKSSPLRPLRQTGAVFSQQEANLRSDKMAKLL